MTTRSIDRGVLIERQRPLKFRKSRVMTGARSFGRNNEDITKVQLANTRPGVPFKIREGQTED